MLMERKLAVAAMLVLAAVTFAYSNHFRNEFHFDDGHSITENVFIRDLSNLPRFFTDTTTSSALPGNRSWRPLVTVSLAIDYWLAGGYAPLYFHLSTFLWFLTQLALMYLLFAAILARTFPDGRHAWLACFAVAWYGLHPAMAETVNYIIQRAEVLSTCGVVAGMALYARLPRLRKFGLYLAPAAAALMVKPPAVVFPVLLAAYILLFEERLSLNGMKSAALKSIPAVLLCLALIGLSSAMTPAAFNPGSTSASAYILTQPYVAFRYFLSFFLPLHLSADTDLTPLPSLFTLEAFGGFVFLAALLFTIVATARHERARPVSFGLFWFLVAMAPTSLFPLAEVENDHRMFFPFVGLTLAVSCAGALLLAPARRTTAARGSLAVGLACLLILCALGTRRRNEVWRTEESLWKDVTLKSPNNGRGQMNYGLTLMRKGDYRGALNYFERAAVMTPNYSTLEINLAIANGGLKRDAEAEGHFQRALELAPANADGHFYYGRWLQKNGRIPQAVELNPVRLDSRHLLLRLYAEQQQTAELKSLAEETLKLAPGDPAAQRYLAGGGETPASLLNQSLRAYQGGDYEACIRLARQALELQPEYAEAHNNVAAAHAAMGNWDEAIEEAQEALRIKPDYPLARGNLQWAMSEKQSGKPR